METPASLLERLRRPGEDAAWDRFVRWYTPFIYHWANGVGLQSADAADLVPEVLTSLIQKLHLFDVDKDGHITEAEYEQTRAICNAANNRLVAIRPGGRGDVTRTHVIWEVNKGLPYMPSPVLHQGKLIIVKDGGLMSCLDAQTGKLLSQERIYGTGRYYSSPVIVNGKLYLANPEGRLSVVEASPGTRLLQRVAFEEEVYATPAVAGGRMYFRTKDHLYCFGREGSP